MEKTRLIYNLIFHFQDKGIEKTENGTILIGKAPFRGNQAWLNKIYPVITNEDIIELSKMLRTDIPNEYVNFLTTFSNGLNILLSTFSLYGLRKELGRSIEASRQPYSIITPNIHERPDNAEEYYFFIGGYNWDGSHLYIDKETNKVHCCERYDATSRKSWNSLEEMVIDEIKRIYTLFDENGKELDENKEIIPY